MVGTAPSHRWTIVGPNRIRALALVLIGMRIGGTQTGLRIQTIEKVTAFENEMPSWKATLESLSAPFASKALASVQLECTNGETLYCWEARNAHCRIK
jgi:hypothetical protein